MAYKGTVFKVKPKSLILMTGDFEFKEIKKRATVQTGQEVIFDDQDIVLPHNRRWMTLAASLLVFVLFSSALLQQVLVPEVYAYVGMDLNPSLELALDKKLKVIRAEARDEEAQEVLQNLALQGLNLQQAVNTVLESCSDRGYIDNSTSHIMISTTINSNNIKEKSQPADVPKLEEQVLSYTREQLEKKQKKVNVYVVTVNKAEREEALSQGMSAGQYFLWNKSREKGIELETEKDNTQGMNNMVQHNKRVQDLLTESAAVKWKKNSGQKVKVKDSTLIIPSTRPGKTKSATETNIKGKIKEHPPVKQFPPNTAGRAPASWNKGINENKGNQDHNDKSVKPGEKGPIVKYKDTKNNRDSWIPGQSGKSEKNDPQDKTGRNTNNGGGASAGNINSTGATKNKGTPQSNQTYSPGTIKNGGQKKAEDAPKNRNKNIPVNKNKAIRNNHNFDRGKTTKTSANPNHPLQPGLIKPGP